MGIERDTVSLNYKWETHLHVWTGEEGRESEERGKINNSDFDFSL